MLDKSVHSLVEFDRNQSWLLGNYDSLLDNYGNKYVAVLKQEIVRFSDDIQSLVNELKQTYKNQFDDIYIEFLFKEHPNFVLM